MVRLSRWCIAHRRSVIAGWVLIATLATVIAGTVGRHYATNFTLPGTESQRVVDLLGKEFRAQSGDVDTIVFHTANGTIDDAAVRDAITPLLSKVDKIPHVVSVISPYSRQGAFEVSTDRRTAFATVGYDERANLLPDETGQPVLDAVNAIDVSGLKVAAGG